MSEEFPTPACHCRCGKSAIDFWRGAGCTCAWKAPGVATLEEPREVAPPSASTEKREGIIRPSWEQKKQHGVIAEKVCLFRAYYNMLIPLSSVTWIAKNDTLLKRLDC